MNTRFKIILIILIAACVSIPIVYYAQIALRNNDVDSLRESAKTEYTPSEKKKKVPSPVTVSNEPQEPAPNYGVEDHSFDFEVLHRENPDIYAWITIPNTVIDYPILQSGEGMAEDFYLDHNLDMSSGYPGCIYTQRINSKDFLDPVNVIYGHNMKNGTFFGGLRLIYTNTDSYADKNLIHIYTPGFKKTYRIIASCTFDNRLLPASFNGFKTEADKAAYLDEFISKAFENGTVDPARNLTSGDDIKGPVITLSTCISNDTLRYLVLAERIE